MRLKTMPRQRRPNYLHTPIKTSEHIRSTRITQDVSEKFIDSHKHGQTVKGLKELKGKKREVLKAASKYDPMQLAGKKCVAKIGRGQDTLSLSRESSGAVNLSMKNSFEDGSSEPDCDKFTGTVLYQIMTDPTFLENIKNNKEMKKLTCKFCKRKFANYSELLDHLESRLDEFDRITCCACRKTFGQKRYLRYHQRCHVVNDKFTCEICMKTYSRMDNLTRHKTYHTNPNKYSCEICKKTFTRRDLMTKHSKSHEGKKINCDICRKVFIDLNKLKAHRLICTKNTRGTEAANIED